MRNRLNSTTMERLIGTTCLVYIGHEQKVVYVSSCLAYGAPTTEGFGCNTLGLYTTELSIKYFHHNRHAFTFINIKDNDDVHTMMKETTYDKNTIYLYLYLSNDCDREQHKNRLIMKTIPA